MCKDLKQQCNKNELFEKKPIIVNDSLNEDVKQLKFAMNNLRQEMVL